ncbi:MAG: hypothetical protein JOZ75_03715 [Candidatus Dormibacteraeota bacterium]|nr:hypothetical protein [Candidatus Dormibacteraeota bacterium]
MSAATNNTDELARFLGDFRLTAREAKVLIALVQLGSATVSQLSRFVGIERANIYRVLEALGIRGLAIQATGPDRTWNSPGRDEIVEILMAEEDARHRAMRTEAEYARQILATLAPEAPQAALPYVQLLSRASEVGRLYDRLLDEAEAEILVCNKAPYGGGPMKIRPAVMSALMRGVAARALYESYELDAAEAEALRQTRLVYHEVGVEGRVVDRLPIRLAVFDRRRALLAMNEPGLPDRFPTNLFVDHPDFAESVALSFEQLWSSARRYRPPTRSAPVLVGVGRQRPNASSGTSARSNRRRQPR